LNYALARTQSTNFNVQTLGGLKQYIAGYVASRKSVSRARILSNNFQRKQAQETVEAVDGRAKSLGFNGALAESMIDHHRAAPVAQRYADKVPTFEQ
jgi:hypothetical protein